MSNFFDSIKAELTKVAAYIPPSIKTIALGEIAKVNLTHPAASGADKRSIVANVMAALTGLEEALWHGFTHVFWLELQAKTPDVLKPLVVVAEDAVNAQADVLIQDGGEKVTTLVQNVFHNSYDGIVVARPRVAANPSPPKPLPSPNVSSPAVAGGGDSANTGMPMPTPAGGTRGLSENP